MKKKPFDNFTTETFIVGLQIVGMMSQMYGHKTDSNATLVKDGDLHHNFKGKSSPGTFNEFVCWNSSWSWMTSQCRTKSNHHFDTVEQFLEWAQEPEVVKVALNEEYTAEIIDREWIKVGCQKIPAKNVLQLAKQIEDYRKHQN